MANRITIRNSAEYDYDPTAIYVAIREQHTTIQALALEHGISNVHLSRILNGRGPFDREHLEWLCNRLKVPIKKVLSPVKH